MFNLQGSEIIVILLLALVVLGPEKLPDAIRRFSQTYAELKKMGTGFQSELKSALDEPMREMRDTADLVMNAADPQKVAEQAEAEAAARAQAKSEDKPIDERAFLVTDPGVERAQADGEAPVADDKPVNQIAAANSSASLAAAARRTDDDANADDGATDARSDSEHVGDDPVGDDPVGDDPVGDDAIVDSAPPSEPAAAPGPAFHSAAPPVHPPAAQSNGADPDDAPGTSDPGTSDPDTSDTSNPGSGAESSEEATAS